MLFTAAIMTVVTISSMTMLLHVMGAGQMIESKAAWAGVVIHIVTGIIVLKGSNRRR